MVTHKDEKPHQCSTCDEYFTTMGNLNTHFLTHTGEKPHRCKLCGKSFPTSNKLKVHMVTHIGKKNINVVHVISILQQWVI